VEEVISIEAAGERGGGQLTRPGLWVVGLALNEQPRGGGGGGKHSVLPRAVRKGPTSAWKKNEIRDRTRRPLAGRSVQGNDGGTAALKFTEIGVAREGWS